MAVVDPSPTEARTVINQLAAGVPPAPSLIDYITVGQEEMRSVFKNDIRNVVHGEYKARALLGDPGAGKTHLLNIARQWALSENLAVAQFTLDTSTKCTLNRPDRIYAAILEALTLPELGGRAINAVQAILQRWGVLALDRVRAPISSMTYLWRVAEAGLLPADFKAIPPRTRLCLLGYILAVSKGNADLERLFIDALHNRGIENRVLMTVIKAEGVSFHTFQPGFTPSIYDATFFCLQLKTIVHMLRLTGASGLALLCDEATGVSDLPYRSSRERAYGLVRSLLTNQYNIDGCYVVLAFMPAFIVQLTRDSDAGMSIFDEAWLAAWKENVRQIPRLSQAQLVDIALRINRMHRIAFNRSLPASQVGAEALTLAVAYRARSLRDWVRYWISSIDAGSALVR